MEYINSLEEFNFCAKNSDTSTVVLETAHCEVVVAFVTIITFPDMPLSPLF